MAKLKSISKKEPQNDFLKYLLGHSEFKPKAKGVKNIWIELYDYMSRGDIEQNINLVDNFSEEENKQLLQKLDIKALSSELYKIKSFKWGGDQTNSLDKYLVTHYVKSIKDFETLEAKIPEIGEAAYGYVMSSWYNHWSSILIEFIFKSNRIVIPTVGQVKGVDFFVNGYPFDLKVTHLPKGFVDKILKMMNCQSELSYLKKEAKAMGIGFDKEANDNIIHHQIWKQLEDLDNQEASNIIKTVKSRRQDILKYAMSNPKELSKWLYENQGDMRFGAENRLFLVLIDNENWDNSWELKRNLNLLEPKIQEYLHSFSSKNIEDLRLSFNYKSRSYQTYADIIFVIKN